MAQLQTTTIFGDLYIADTATGIFGVNRMTGNANGRDLSIYAGGTYPTAINKNGGDLLLKSGIATGSGSSKVSIWTTTAGTSGTTDVNPTEKMTILGSGNVGIGTTTPNAKLEVNGGISAQTISATTIYSGSTNLLDIFTGGTTDLSQYWTSAETQTQLNNYSLTSHTHSEYITGYTETDPIWEAEKSGYSLTSHTHSQYVNIYGHLYSTISGTTTITSNALDWVPFTSGVSGLCCDVTADASGLTVNTSGVYKVTMTCSAVPDNITGGWWAALFKNEEQNITHKEFVAATSRWGTISISGMIQCLQNDKISFRIRPVSTSGTYSFDIIGFSMMIEKMN